MEQQKLSDNIFNLAADVLSNTYLDYINALKIITRLKDAYLNEVLPKKQKAPSSLTKKEIRIAYNFEGARNEMLYCESFYRSEKYKRFTLGKGIDGEEVIKAAKKSVNYVDCDLYAL